MLENEIKRKYSMFVSVSSASQFSPKDARREAGRAGCTMNCYGDDCYIIDFRDSIVPAGPYTPAAIAASERENGHIQLKTNRYRGHRVRIENHFQDHNFSFVLTAKVKEENDNVLTLVDVEVLRSTGVTQVDDLEFKFVITEDATQIEILD